MRNYLSRGNRDLVRWPGERLFFDADDGSGDRFQGVLHRCAGAPLVVLVHGLTGCEGSFYVLETAANMLSAGYSVLRLNLRGAGPSRTTCGGHYCAGSSGDLAIVLRQLPQDLTAAGLVLAGYSLGGNIVLKYLADGASEIAPNAAMAVSPTIDLASSAERMLDARNRLYHCWLLKRMKEEAVMEGAQVSVSERRAIESARTVVEFDDRFVAPRNGFRDAADYYAQCSTVHRLGDIDVPVVLIHADNDPWIPAASFPRNDVGTVRVLLTGGGGHVGFHGRGSKVPWHDRCMLAFARANAAPQPVTCP
ncbi:MAG: YheT family hydrolase [Alphaproteobacteria bacterium]